MKKILVFLTIALYAVSASAQTFNETQKRVELKTAELENRLNEVKDKIFYLKITLPEKMAKAKSLAVLQSLRKESLFSDGDIKKLDTEKAALEESIKTIKDAGLASTEYRVKADAESNLPERMTKLEYAQRVRANDLKSETSGQRFEGLLANYKQGVGEIATFTISRKGIKGLPETPAVLKPGEIVKYSLPAGEYKVKITSGSYCREYEFTVNPKITKWFEGRPVYWAAYKALSDQ